MKIKINTDKLTAANIKQAKPKVKVNKLIFNENNATKNPEKEFDLFDREVTSIISRTEKITPDSFFGKLNMISTKFLNENKTDTLNKKCKYLAEKLVGLGDGKLAGIIYSLLIKINSDNIKMVEQLATNGLAIAKRFHDPVHIMARCEDLRKIYSITEPQSNRLVKVLYEEKRALNNICKDYSGAQNRFMSISKKMKPLQNYQIMLCRIKIQLAKIIKDSDPNNAIYELESAHEILSKYKKGKYLQEIEALLKELKN